MRRAAAFSFLVFMVLLAAHPSARAQEPWLVPLEATVAFPMGSPQSDVFGAGGTLAAGMYRPVTPWLLVGARLRVGLLLDGSAPQDPGLADPGTGGLATLGVGARFRLPGPSDDVRRGTGLFAEVLPAGVLTGDQVRFGFEAGLGFGMAIGVVDVAPTLRYVQVIQPGGGLAPEDARLVLLGVEVTLLDARAEPPRPEPIPDTDGDGILDPDDACPREPEDPDGFEDEDGCPDPDNDQDGVLDVDDECPLIPEDRDGFADMDGCPDPDNDGDGILDGADGCPDQAETVNAVDDDDGCPDQGLIEFVDDRIVLDDTVLFAFDRAYLAPVSRPVIAAILQLWRLHPEWVRVRIEGHTDVRGDSAYNMRLSERRARAVMVALVNGGMPQDMIEAVGFGETRPLNLGSRPATMMRNRRVEFVVIERREVTRGADGTVDPQAEPDAATPRPEGPPEESPAPDDAPDFREGDATEVSP